IDIMGPRRWDYTEGTNYASYAGRSDLCVVADEIAWPEPTIATGSIRNSEAKAKYEGPSETVVINMIAANVGTNRHANRTIDAEPTDPWLIEMPTTEGRGPTTTVSARYEPLMDLTRNALEPTDLDIRVVPNEARDGLALEVFQYRDMTDE